MNLNPYCTPYTKINLKQNIHLNVTAKTMKFLQQEKNLSNPELNRTHKLEKKSK